MENPPPLDTQIIELPVFLNSNRKAARHYCPRPPTRVVAQVDVDASNSAVTVRLVRTAAPAPIGTSMANAASGRLTGAPLTLIPGGEFVLTLADSAKLGRALLRAAVSGSRS